MVSQYISNMMNSLYYLDENIAVCYNLWTQIRALGRHAHHTEGLDWYKFGSLSCNHLHRSLNKWSNGPKLPSYHQLQGIIKSKI